MVFEIDTGIMPGSATPNVRLYGTSQDRGSGVTLSIDCLRIWIDITFLWRRPLKERWKDLK